MNKPKGLGRGLDALLGGDEAPREALLTLPVGRIRPGKYQPRTKMDQQALAELAGSIRSQGLMQPLLVRPIDRDRIHVEAADRRHDVGQALVVDRHSFGQPPLLRPPFGAARDVSARKSCSSGRTSYSSSSSRPSSSR